MVDKIDESFSCSFSGLSSGEFEDIGDRNMVDDDDITVAKAAPVTECLTMAEENYSNVFGRVMLPTLVLMFEAISSCADNRSSKER